LAEKFVFYWKAGKSRFLPAVGMTINLNCELKRDSSHKKRAMENRTSAPGRPPFGAQSKQGKKAPSLRLE